MTFTKWFTTFVAEKNINVDRMIEVDGPSGLNMIPVAVLIEAINAAPANEQAAIKTMLVKIDFANAPVATYAEAETHMRGAV